MDKISEKPDYYRKLVPVAKVAMNTAYYRKVEGEENIPDEPAIYAANHVKAVDSILMALAFYEKTGKVMRLGAKQEYFDGKGVNNKGQLGRLARLFVEYTHQIPIVRDGATREDYDRLNSAVKEAMDVHHESIGLHVEGTRSPDGRLYKVKYGAAKIALTQSRIIVPTGLIFEEPAPLVMKSIVRFGEPIDTSEYIDGQFSKMPGRDKVAHLSERIEEEIASLTGQERAGVFADAYAKHSRK